MTQIDIRLQSRLQLQWRVVFESIYTLQPSSLQMWFRHFEIFKLYSNKVISSVRWNGIVKKKRVTNGIIRSDAIFIKHECCRNLQSPLAFNLANRGSLSPMTVGKFNCKDFNAPPSPRLTLNYWKCIWMLFHTVRHGKYVMTIGHDWGNGKVLLYLPNCKLLYCEYTYIIIVFFDILYITRLKFRFVSRYKDYISINLYQ